VANPLADLANTYCAGDRDLLRADIYALRVEVVRLEQSNEIAASVAEVDDGFGLPRQQQGTDVTPVDKSSRLAGTADVLGGVRLVEPVSERGELFSECHSMILLDYF